MEFPKASKNTLFLLQALFFLLHSTESALPTANSNLFSIYIGAEFTNVTFSDVPINPNVKFQFILSFAIDYTSLSSPSPTNGKFNVFWDSQNLTPSKASSIKRDHSNVKLALSIGGDSVGNQSAYFKPTSIHSWVSNAVSSLTKLIKEYHLDGIDIDYEHFQADANTFAECIGRLITTLKKNRVISFASIAPYADPEVQTHYLALWRRYGHVIDYVNFQFYSYAKDTTVAQFMKYLRTQRSNYRGGRVLVSYISDGSHGLSPEKDFFVACKELKRRRELQGIFVWCADESKPRGFRYEKRSQALLAIPH